MVVNPGLQTDDCEADAIIIAYRNINMVEVAVWHAHVYAIPVVLIWRWPTGILQAIIKCYCLPRAYWYRYAQLSYFV